MVNRTLLSLQGNKYTIYTNGIIISGQSVSIAPSWLLFGLSVRKHRTIIEIYNHHRTPCTSYNAMLSIPKAQKTAEALNETSKTDPKTT